MRPELVVGRSQIRSTWPPRRSITAGPAPLYCTVVSGTPIASWKSMAQRGVARQDHHGRLGEQADELVRRQGIEVELLVEQRNGRHADMVGQQCVAVGL